ncbi:MAG: hypothetical protein IPL70_09260 [Uliginosibacterium sp.]|nr:hypothetical protein [Uliginosibacterium sp.]
MPLLATGSTRTKVTPAQLASPTFLDTTLYNPVASKRWHITPEIAIQPSEASKKVMETINGEQKATSDYTPEKVLALILGQHPKYADILSSYSCQNNLGFYIVDADSNLLGVETSDGIYPYAINNQSLLATVMDRGNIAAATGKIELMFDLRKSESFAKEGSIGYSQMGGLDLLFVNDMTTVNLTVSTITTTTVSVTVKTQFGAVGNKDKWVGLEVSSFSLYNETNSSAIVITSVEETTSGYNITFPIQTVSDSVLVSVVEPGLDSNSVSVVIS